MYEACVCDDTVHMHMCITTAPDYLTNGYSYHALQGNPLMDIRAAHNNHFGGFTVESLSSAT